ncbi:hypothetical protein SEVIR_5G087150v4 [Setaria viridis]
MARSTRSAPAPRPPPWRWRETVGRGRAAGQATGVPARRPATTAAAGWPCRACAKIPWLDQNHGSRSRDGRERGFIGSYERACVARQSATPGRGRRRRGGGCGLAGLTWVWRYPLVLARRRHLPRPGDTGRRGRVGLGGLHRVDRRLRRILICDGDGTRR